jgi:hypothetical protein
MRTERRGQKYKLKSYAWKVLKDGELLTTTVKIKKKNCICNSRRRRKTKGEEKQR